jgi:hypothetical protein
MALGISPFLLISWLFGERGLLGMFSPREERGGSRFPLLSPPSPGPRKAGLLESGRADPLPQPIDPQPPQPNSHSLANSEQRDAKEVLVIVRRLQVADFWCEKRMEEG